MVNTPCPGRANRIQGAVGGVVPANLPGGGARRRTPLSRDNLPCTVTLSTDRRASRSAWQPAGGSGTNAGRGSEGSPSVTTTDLPSPPVPATGRGALDVLLIEDDLGDAFLVQEFLEESD